MKMNEEKMFKKLTGKVHVAPDSHKKKKKTGEQNDVRSHLHARETIYRQIKFI